jgi:hypothetical protein
MDANAHESEAEIAVNPCALMLPAKDGLQKRPQHGRRLQSLESRWLNND